MYKCQICGKKYTELSSLYNHIESIHREMIPKDMSVQQYYYYMKTGKTNGNCVMCKHPTTWNEKTNKYNRFCSNPKCKEEYSKIMKSRMIAKYGKAHLLNDPNKQREMLANRSISGVYEWRDGKTETTYTGSYELDFLKTMDDFFEWDPSDIMMPSPHTYTYKYEGEDKFYIPDVFIPSLNLEIEIKDGGDNPNNHHKIQAVDKEKEKLKDEVLMTQKNFHYVKLTNKNFTNFFDFMKEYKKGFEKFGDENKIPRIFKVEDIRTKPDVNVLKESVEVVGEGLINDTLYKLDNVTFAKNKSLIYRNYDQVKKSPKELQKYINRLIKAAKFEEDLEFIDKLIKHSNDEYHNILKHKPELKEEYNEYIAWIRDPHCYEQKVKEQRRELKESTEYVEEIYKPKDLYVNFDKFESGESNICLITGLSGSGKSTLSNEICKEHNALCIEMDIFEHPDMEYDKSVKRPENLYYDYFNKNKQLRQDLMENNLSNKELANEMNKFLNYVLEYCIEHKESKFVIEGLQIFADIDPKYVKGLPIIFVNTPMITSMIRKVKRDQVRYNLIEMFKWYMDDEKKYRNFKEEILEEKFEPDKFLVWFDKPIQKLKGEKIKLYHGTLERRKGDTFVPFSINVGATKYSDPRWSIYFWDNREDAMLWSSARAVMDIVGVENMLYIGHNEDGKVIVKRPKGMTDKEFANYLIEKSGEFYIYEVEVDIKDLEVGARPIIREYTVSKPVDILKEYKYKLNKEIIRRCVRMVDEVQFKDYDEKYGILNNTDSKRGPVLNAILDPHRNSYRPILISELRNGNVKPGDDISDFRYSINRHLKANTYNFESYNIDNIDNISEYYAEEKFEPDKFLVWFDKPIQKAMGKKIRLYHGTKDRVIGKEIKNLSVNVGATKYSDPRWSIFFWDNREDAMKWASAWAVVHAVSSSRADYIAHNGKTLVVKPEGMSDKAFIKYLEDNVSEFYVYEVEVDINDLEIGSCPTVREYTVSKAVPILKEYKYRINKEIINRCFRFVTEQEFEEHRKKYGYIGSMPLHRGPILNHILKTGRDPYQRIVRTDMKMGNIKPGDDLSSYKYSINHHFKNDTYGFFSVKESSISYSHLNYCLQQETDELLKKYLDDYTDFYYDMISEKPEAEKHINEDIKKAIKYIDDLSEKEDINNDMLYTAKWCLGDLVGLNKHSKPNKHSKYTQSLRESSITLEALAKDGKRTVWVGADWHFYTKYNDNLKENPNIDKIINNFNKVIKPNDIVIFLGDLYDARRIHDKKEMPNLKKIKRLKGYKIFVKGNHDVDPDKAYYDLGFNEVHMKYILGNVVFTHEPVNVDKNQVNVHGHLHYCGDYWYIKPKSHIDVYTARFKYKPVSLTDAVTNYNDGVILPEALDNFKATFGEHSTYESYNSFNIKLIYEEGTRRLFSMNDINSKIIVNEQYVLQKDKAGVKYNISPMEIDYSDKQVIEFNIVCSEAIELDYIMSGKHDVVINSLYNDDNLNFIKETCNKLFGFCPEIYKLSK